MRADFHRLVEALHREQVAYVLIGGLALIAHGGARVTEDLDLCYARDRENLVKLATALGPFHPRLRGAPPELPFFFDAATLRSGLNFTLASDAGDVDLLGEVAGVGTYADAARDADTVQLFGCELRMLSLDALERSKRAAGRVKDLLDLATIAELRNVRS